jgi:hypothetical protein
VFNRLLLYLKSGVTFTFEDLWVVGDLLKKAYVVWGRYKEGKAVDSDVSFYVNEIEKVILALKGKRHVEICGVVSVSYSNS